MAEERILERIQRLIAHAEGTQNEAEAANYWEKAQELMTKYAIDEAMARSAGKQTREEVVVHRVNHFGNKRYNTQKMQLMHSICRTNRCRLIRAYKDEFMYVVGMESDTRFCEMLWTSLILESWRWMLADFHAYRKDPSQMEMDYDTGAMKHVGRPIYIDNWLTAFRGRVETRLREHNEYIEKQVATAKDTEGSTVALALRDVSLAIDDKIRRQFGELGKARPRGSRTYSGAARSAGSAAGDKADITAGRKMGGNPRRLT